MSYSQAIPNIGSRFLNTLVFNYKTTQCHIDLSLMWISLWLMALIGAPNSILFPHVEMVVSPHPPNLFYDRTPYQIFSPLVSDSFLPFFTLFHFPCIFHNHFHWRFVSPLPFTLLFTNFFSFFFILPLFFVSFYFLPVLLRCFSSCSLYLSLELRDHPFEFLCYWIVHCCNFLPPLNFPQSFSPHCYVPWSPSHACGNISRE